MADDTLGYPNLNPFADKACPYLGMVTDPATRFAYPSSRQRCFVASRPSRIDEGKQARQCLVAQHASCPLYVRLNQPSGGSTVPSRNDPPL